MKEVNNSGKKFNIVTIVVAILVGIVAIVGIFLLIGGNDKKLEDQDQNNPPAVTEELTTVVISINPKLALEVDKNQNVKNMYPLNDDAKEFNRSKYIGKKLEESIETVLEDASKYLKKDKNITISIAKGETVKLDDVAKIIQEKNEEIIVKKEELTEEIKNEIIEQVEEIKDSDKKEDEQKEEQDDEAVNKDEEDEKGEDKEEEVVKSSNANLSSLSVDKISISFKKNTISYSGLVEYSVASVKVSASSEHSKAKVSGTGTKKLSVGDNTLKVKVTAEDGTTKTYTINIERRAEYNLNDNLVYVEMAGSIGPSYVYPTNEACIGKDPFSLEIPEGQTYDTYCQNNILTNYPKVTGKGYTCSAVDSPAYDSSAEGMTASKPYVCQWLDDIADETEMENGVDKVLKVGNYYDVGGGMGGGEEVTLNEKLCTKYNITCGRW